MHQGRYRTLARGVLTAVAALGLIAVPLLFTPVASDMGQFGPFDTALQHGYESANVISPILPASYGAGVGPRILGVQFLGDSPHNLHDDHFAIQVQGGTRQLPNFFWHGLVGRQLPHRLAPGTYHVIFHVSGFDLKMPTWTITVRAGQPYALANESSTAIMLDSLNTIRKTLGLKPAIQSSSLNQASQAHAQYLSTNGFSAPSFHVESPQRPGFTGMNPWNRDLYFGWPTPETGEVGVEWSIPTQTPTVMQDLIDTIFHRLCLLSGNLESVGAGESTGPNGSMVMDLGYGYRADLPRAIVYPFPGQPGVPTNWTDIESPDPVNGGYDRRFGYPITVDFPTVDKLSRVRVQLRAHGRTWAVVVDEPGVGDLGSNQVGLVPRHALWPNARYRVTVSAHALFTSGTTRDVHLVWEFATGASDQSLAATTESRHHLVLADLVCGSGVPWPHQRLRLYRLGPQHVLIEVAQGRTNDSGLWSLQKKVSPGYYEAISQSQNAVVFWWGG